MDNGRRKSEEDICWVMTCGDVTCLRDRRPRQNDKAKEQEWFLGVFDEAENRSKSLPSQPVMGPTCDLLQVQMTENQDDDELAAVNDDVAF